MGELKQDNMKAFDLEKALAGEPVVTRDGKPVTYIHYFKTAYGASIFGIIDEYPQIFREDGAIASGFVHENDLFMAEKPKAKKEGWVNLSYNIMEANHRCGTMMLRGNLNIIGVFDKPESEPSENNYWAKIEWEEEA